MGRERTWGMLVVSGALALGALGCDGRRAEARPEALARVVSAAPPASAAPITPTYVVRPNDGWSEIARKHGVRLEDVLAANAAEASTVIHPGQTLRLPPHAQLAAPPSGPAGSPSPRPVTRPPEDTEPEESEPTPRGAFIPYAGNGLGPTVCADGSISHSSGRGTCSHHGGTGGGHPRSGGGHSRGGGHTGGGGGHSRGGHAGGGHRGRR